jgi:hypothetical protein
VQPATGRPAAGAGRTAFGSAVAEALDAVANRLDTGATVPPADLRSPLAALGAGTRQDGELALCEALTDRVEALQRAAGVA